MRGVVEEFHGWMEGGIASDMGRAEEADACWDVKWVSGTGSAATFTCCSELQAACLTSSFMVRQTAACIRVSPPL